MAKFIEDRYFSAPATNDLTGKQYYLVGLDTTNKRQVVLANAQTTIPVGALLTEGKAGDVVTVVLAQNGSMKVIAGGTINAGAFVTADGNGKAIATTTAGDQVVGVAVAGGVSGDIIDVICQSFRY